MEHPILDPNVFSNPLDLETFANAYEILKRVHETEYAYKSGLTFVELPHCYDPAGKKIQNAEYFK